MVAPYSGLAGPPSPLPAEPTCQAAHFSNRGVGFSRFFWLRDAGNRAESGLCSASLSPEAPLLFLYLQKQAGGGHGLGSPMPVLAHLCCAPGLRRDGRGEGQEVGWLRDQRADFGDHAGGLGFRSPYPSPGGAIAGASQGPDVRAGYPGSWGNRVVPEDVHEAARQALSWARPGPS